MCVEKDFMKPVLSCPRTPADMISIHGPRVFPQSSAFKAIVTPSLRALKLTRSHAPVNKSNSMPLPASLHTVDHLPPAQPASFILSPISSAAVGP